MRGCCLSVEVWCLKCKANKTKTPAWEYRKDGNCLKRTFQGRHHVSEHTKGYVVDSGGVVVMYEDIHIYMVGLDF